MNLKACTFERLPFISLGFGRGAQVGKTSLLEVDFIYGASVDVGRTHYFIWYASGPGIPTTYGWIWRIQQLGKQMTLTVPGRSPVVS